MKREIKISGVKRIDVLRDYATNEATITFKGDLCDLELDEDFSKFIETGEITLVCEEKEDLLDMEERTYLRSVLSPFRDKNIIITKETYGDDEEYLEIEIDGEDIDFPNFPKGSMYKKMEAYQDYTLEDLGI